MRHLIYTLRIRTVISDHSSRFKACNWHEIRSDLTICGDKLKMWFGFWWGFIGGGR
ncbi:hypothetical protein Hanom_Chr03g00257321 [Helianthus anomalus]